MFKTLHFVICDLCDHRAERGREADLPEGWADVELVMDNDTKFFGQVCPMCKLNIRHTLAVR